MINKSRLKRKLRPFYWSMYDKTMGAIAADCRAAGVPLVMVIIPRVGKSDLPVTRSRAGRAAQGHRVAPGIDGFRPVRRV